MQNVSEKIRIKISWRQIAVFILAGLLLTLNFTMRYGVSKKMRSYNVDKTRYEKLALAHHLGGAAGIDFELKTMAKYDASAGDFVSRTSAQIKETKDVQLFIKSAMARDRNEIKRLKTNRFVLSSVIYLVLGAQALLSMQNWWKNNRRYFQKSTQ